MDTDEALDFERAERRVELTEAERRRLHAELERLFQPYAQEIAEEVWGKDARADRELVAIQDFEPCPRCWSGEEECEACDGTGMLHRF